MARPKLLALGAALLASPALAQNSPVVEPWDSEEGPLLTSTAELIRELEGSNAGDRLFAGRELLRRIRLAKKQVGGKNDLKRFEGRTNLADYKSDVPGPCIRALDEANVRRLAALILLELDHTPALDALRGHAATEARRRVSKAIVRAIDHLEAL